MAEKPVEIRDLEFKELLEADPTTPYAAARWRLERILTTAGDVHGDKTPPAVESLASFLQARPIWRKHIHPSVLAYPVQRVHRSGLCYMHAPVVVQHYLVSMRTKSDAGMIDVAAMIRDTWNGKDLTRHIFDAHGDNARTMLERILVEGSVATSQVSWDRFPAHLKRFGPALVSMFEVRDEFYLNTHEGIFDGVASGQVRGYHAMALVGARTDEQGKRWFLLQNWWPKMQFVEVSESYLESSGAEVYFVKTPQPHIPTSFPQYKAAYGDSADLDKEESDAMFEEPSFEE
jgi:hypothetical protein